MMLSVTEAGDSKREIDLCKKRIKKFVEQSTDEQFDLLVAEANKVGFRELTRKLLIVWVQCGGDKK